MTKKFFPFLFLLLLLVAACKLPNDSVIEPETPPEITRISLYPSRIEVDKISDLFDPETVVDTLITISVQVHDINNDIGTIYFTIISPHGLKLANNIPLNDQGRNSDSVAHDGIYFGAANISFKKKEIGNYSIQVVIGDKKQNVVNALSVLSVINTFNKAPQLSSLIIADTSVIKTGKDSVAVKISVRVTDVQGLSDIKEVNATIINFDDDYSASLRMYDDGGINIVPPYFLSSGDSIANDGIYSVQILFSKKHVATYLLQVSARDSALAVSTTLQKQFSIKNQINNKPVLSNLSMPDTAKVPVGSDTTFVRITINVTDAEGLDDIYLVNFTSRRPDGTVSGTFRMYDDGNTIVRPELNLVSGDSTANDGIFTLTVPLLKGTVVPTYRDFVFQAKDRANEVSTTITKRIHLQ